MRSDWTLYKKLSNNSLLFCQIVSLWSGVEYTYTTLSDLSNTASYEQCDNGCGTTTYRCKSDYTYSNGKCVAPSKTCEDYTSGQNIYVTPGPSVNPNKQCKALTLPSGKQYGFDDAYPAGGSMRCLKCAVKGSGSGGSSNNCTAGSYTASVTCSFAYSSNKDCKDPSDHRCGNGYFTCVFDVPSCAFSNVEVYNVSGTHTLSAGAGTSTQKNIISYNIPGKCKFYASSSYVGESSATGSNYTWTCSYTRTIR